MSYEQANQVAQTWGLILLTGLFAGAVLYALWTANRERFKRAASMQLNDGESDDR